MQILLCWGFWVLCAALMMRTNGSTEIGVHFCRPVEHRETPGSPLPAERLWGKSPSSAISILQLHEQFACLVQDPVNIWAFLWASKRTWKGLSTALGKVDLASLS